jgi:hypothetical protein
MHARLRPLVRERQRDALQGIFIVAHQAHRLMDDHRRVRALGGRRVHGSNRVRHALVEALSVLARRGVLDQRGRHVERGLVHLLGDRADLC